MKCGTKVKEKKNRYERQGPTQ